VLYDAFNGTSLDTNKWISFFSWPGMPYVVAPGDTIYKDNDNWVGACRYGNGDPDDDSWNAVQKDANVVVSNGTCKLLVKHEPASWHCDTCTSYGSTKYYTDGTIQTPYLLDNHANHFNSGRFEIRMKHPVYAWAHTTVWTWYGAHDGVDELDMTESYGPGIPPNGVSPIMLYAPGVWRTFATKNNIGLSAWGIDFDDTAEHPLPYTTDEHAAPNPIPAYPHQSYFDWLFGTYLDIGQWHTYTCEWDSTMIVVYLDHQLCHVMWKYYHNEHFSNGGKTYIVPIGTDCQASGINYVTYGFPYRTTSLSNFRVTTHTDGGQGAPTSGSTTLGQAEIDYIEMWQRHPEDDGHTDICTYSGALPVISGPVVAGPSYTFTVSNPAPTGYWTCGSDFVISSSSNSSVTLQYTGSSGYLSHAVAYVYSPAIPGCPVKEAKKYFHTDLQLPEPFQPVSILDAQMDNTDMHQFVLARTDPSPDMGLHNTEAQYTWNISFSLGADTPQNLVHYRTKGKYAATPFVNFQGSKAYYLKWELTIATPYDTGVLSGERNSQSELYRQKNDSAVWYFDALITDTAKYESAVYDRVLNRMVGEDADSIDILSMINQIRMEELEPYLVIDTAKMKEMRSIAGVATAPVSGKIYPNPAGSLLNIEPGDRYQGETPVSIEIYSLTGELKKQVSMEYAAGAILTLDIHDLAPAIYFVAIRQGAVVERHKLVKSGS